MTETELKVIEDRWGSTRISKDFDDLVVEVRRLRAMVVHVDNVLFDAEWNSAIDAAAKESPPSSATRKRIRALKRPAEGGDGG